MPEITIFPSVKSKEHGHLANQGEVITFSDLIETYSHITSTGWSHLIWNKNLRKEKEFLKTYFIVLDIDQGITRTQTIARLKEMRLNYFLSYSHNHQRPKGINNLCNDRLRIIVPLKEPISSLEDYKLHLKFFMKTIPEIDKQTFDGARFWFPSRKDVQTQEGDIELNESNFCLDNFSDGIRIKYEFKGLKVPSNPEIEKFINLAHSGLDGEWNNSLNNIAFQLGIAQNDSSLIESFLQELAPNPLDSKDLKTLKRAISDGKEQGAEQRRKQKTDFLNLSYEILKELFLNRFHVFQDKSSLRRILEEYIPRTVRRVEKEPMHAMAAQKLKKENLPHAPRKVKEAVDNFILQSELLEVPPVLTTFKSDERLSFQRLDFDPEEGDSPLFDELCSRCSNPEVLKAFIWSIFEEESYSQQYLWLYGNGQDGKSSISNFLYELCDGVVCSPSTNGINSDKHYTAFFLDMRLAIFNDVSSRDFVRSDIIRSLTGSDPVQINPKGEKAYTVRLNLKVFITSNKKPSLSSQSADQRRLLFCELKPFKDAPDVQYAKKLRDERAAILFKCRKSYFVLTKDHGEIRNNLVMNHEFISDDEDVFKYILEQNFKLGKDYKMTPQELSFLIKRLCKENDLNNKEFRAWLERNHPEVIRTNEDTGNGSRRNVLKGIAPLHTFFTLFLIPMNFLSNI